MGKKTAEKTKVVSMLYGFCHARGQKYLSTYQGVRRRERKILSGNYGEGVAVACAPLYEHKGETGGRWRGRGSG